MIARDIRPGDGGQVPSLSLVLAPGLVCVVGPEQQQLTAYLSLLAGITPCATGELRLLGHLTNGPGARDWRLLRRRVGFVTPQAPLLSSMNGLRNVMLPALYHHAAPEREVEQRARTLIGEFGHEVDHESLPAYLDDLQRRLLLIARALILEPRIVLLDRPFVGLDTAAQILLRDYIAGAVHRRVPLVLVAANDRLLAQHADAVLFIGLGAAHLFAGWDAVLAADDAEVQAYLRLERQLCAAFE